MVDILNGTGSLRLSRRNAIKAMCFECSDFSRKEVRNCELTNCKLYPYRTGKGKQDPEARKRAIWDDCLECMGTQAYLVWNCPDGDCPLHPFRMSRADFPVEPDQMEDIKEMTVEPETETA